MAPDPVHELIASIRTRVEAELEAHGPALSARYEQTIAEAREAAQADADRRWSVLLDTHKTQARQELEAAVAEARAESQHGQALLDAFRAIETADSVSSLLTLISKEAAAQSSRQARLYVGPQFDPWNTGESDAAIPEGVAGALRRAATTGSVVSDERSGMAVPLLLDGTAVAVLHAQTDNATQGWADTIELLVRYGAAHLGYLTALRTAHAQRWIAARTPAGSWAPEPATRREADADGDSVQSAKRYARLLVSEIKLYNEAAVREGREQRDLARRLGAEIERARRLYEERVPQSVTDRAGHFHHELVQTLAGGDPALLG